MKILRNFCIFYGKDQSSFAEERSNIFFLVQTRELSAAVLYFACNSIWSEPEWVKYMDFALVGEGRRSRGKHGRAKDNDYSCFSVIIVIMW